MGKVKDYKDLVYYEFLKVELISDSFQYCSCQSIKQDNIVLKSLFLR